MANICKLFMNLIVFFFSDFAMLAASHGQGLFQSMIEDRLRVPLVGIAAVPKVNRNGVAILQVICLCFMPYMHYE